MKLSISIGEEHFSATLNESSTAKDFASLLPLELILDDYASIEKISSLPRKLSIAGTPDGISPKAGDITYYAPWGNIAFFSKNFRHSTGLVKIGEVMGDSKWIEATGTMTIRITKQ